MQRTFSAIVGTMLLACASAVDAQPRVDEFNDYIVRSSVIRADQLPPASASQHGISRADGRGVLNVSVRPRADPLAPPIPAQVTVTAEDLLGKREQIPMREVVQNNAVTYLGTFDFEPRQVLRFEVRVQPEGALAVHTQTFEERFYAQR